MSTVGIHPPDQRFELKIIEYSPDCYDALRRAVEPIKQESALTHRSFVDYYYTSQEWCKLLLALDKNDNIVGTLGIDRMRFESESGEMTLGFSSNYNSFLPGVGSFLFLRRLKDCPLGLVFWTTEDTQKVIRSLGWKYFPDIRRYYLNHPYPEFPNEPLWRKFAKGVLRRLPRKKVGDYASKLQVALDAGVSVKPETSFSSDLLPENSPFGFRFTPDPQYLNWRYNTGLSFVRYRLFRIMIGQESAGYVVINDMPDRLVVAQCDGPDPVTLAYGVMSSIVESGKHDRHPRTVMLTSSHPRMQEIYRQFGFRASTSDECFAIGGYKQDVPLGSDTSTWLVNFDWGNNELQGPFLDQLSDDAVSAEPV
jgi:hypothetical protein